MRMAACLFALSVLIAPTFTSAMAAAQQPRTRPKCDGDFNIIRVSEIKPGKMDTFLKAVEAQQAWYQKGGTPDKISLMRVYDMGTGSFSTTEALTSHVEPGDRTQMVPHDAGYDAFVALYKESSTIKYEYFTCMAK